MPAAYVAALDSVSMRDVARVGGKNASLGELLQHLKQAGRERAAVDDAMRCGIDGRRYLRR